MTLKDKILMDLTGIKNPNLLHQIIEFIQLMKGSYATLPESNKEAVLGFAGVINDEDAQEITAIINSEFNQLLGLK